MNKNIFKLVEKLNLTSDVYLFSFEAENKLTFIPGQFITFLLPKTHFARAYSILEVIGNRFYFIIKKLENGRGGSKEICEIKVGDELIGLGPIGHFLLNETTNNKLFIGTGTGMVPLYCMIINLLQSGYKNSLKLVLGNRFFKDVYFLDKLKELSRRYENFSFDFYLSKEQKKGFLYGRVTEFISKDNLLNYDEIYICGNHNMIDDVNNKLSQIGFDKDKIFFEKY